MFRITAETCRRFTLGEVLIMAAINVAPALRLTQAGEQSVTAPRTGSHEGQGDCHGKSN